MGDHSSTENLKDLDHRLKRAREKSQAIKQSVSSIGKEQSYGYGIAFRIGTEMVAALIVGVGIGYYLDYWLETKPWFLVVFFFLGAGAGVLNVYRAASGLGMGPQCREPSGGVASLVKQQKTPNEDEFEKKKKIGDK
jgi:ATP synthase protein I